MANLQGYEQLRARFRAIGGAGSAHLMGTLGHAVISETGNLAKPHRKTGNLIRSLKLGMVTPKSVTVEAGANYAAVFQFGSQAHTITPNARKALRWAGTGGARLSGTPTKSAQRSGNVHFATVVHHPGTKPYPFLIEGAQKAIKGTFGDEIVKAWNGAA